MVQPSEPVNELIRTDGLQDDPSTLTDVPSTKKFTCISPFKDVPEQIAAIGQEKFESLPVLPYM